MSKAYTQKFQFNKETGQNIERIQKLLRNEYENLIRQGYTPIEAYDMINHANFIQRGKIVFENL